MNNLLKYWAFKLGIQKDPNLIEFHPTLKRNPAIKYSFSVENKHYYRFESGLDIPINRLRMMQKFHREMDMCVDQKTLIEFCEKMLEHLNAGEKPKIIDAARLIDELKYRAKFAFEPETLHRLASCTYFTLDEPLEIYDFHFNDKKIESFKKKDSLLRYFLQSLLSNSSSLLGLSDYDFQDYLRTLKNRLKRQHQLISEEKPSAS